ncbi:MAG: MBL fold metallo-hydrolase [Dehalococcoidia bacterium]
MELAPGIHRITVGEAPGPGLFPPNSYLVTGSETAVMIDSGWDREGHIQARLDYWAQLGRPRLASIILTHRHPDHVGGAAAIGKATGATIVAHPEERAPVEERMNGAARVGRLASDGETLELGGLTLELIHSPGHTRGSLSVFVRERQALFTGDNVMGAGTSVIEPEEGDLGLYLQSLERLLRYPVAVIYPGHGPVVSDAQAKLQGLIQHRQEREQQVIVLLREGSRTVDQLLAAIYPELDNHLHHLARNQVRSHLLKLAQEGRVMALAGEAWALA